MSNGAGPAVWLLAIGQTLIYAGCYYSFPALLPDLEAGTGWGKATLAFGPTLGFLIMAVLTVVSGRLVDRGLGGEMLIWGPVGVALGVAGLGFAATPWHWYLAWALIGVAQAGCLYETCFAFLTRRMGDGARAAITKVTLVAGFAGTVAFPLGHWFGAAFGGQGGMLAFAAMPLLAAPCNLIAVRSLRRRERAGVRLAPTPAGTLGRALRKPAFWMLAAAFLAIYLNHGVLLTYVLVLFEDRGAAPAMAAFAAASIGPAQVAGRLVLLAAGGRVTTGRATRVSVAGMVVASLMLWLAGFGPGLIFVFAVVQGGAIGVMSILRPVLIAEVLGREGFGVISGAVAVAPILAAAAAPSVGAGLLDLGGAGLVYGSCLALAGVGLGVTVVLLRGRDGAAG